MGGEMRVGPRIGNSCTPMTYVMYGKTSTVLQKVKIKKIKK